MARSREIVARSVCFARRVFAIRFRIQRLCTNYITLLSRRNYMCTPSTTEQTCFQIAPLPSVKRMGRSPVFHCERFHTHSTISSHCYSDRACTVKPVKPYALGYVTRPPSPPSPSHPSPQQHTIHYHTRDMLHEEECTAHASRSEIGRSSNLALLSHDMETVTPTSSISADLHSSAFCSFKCADLLSSERSASMCCS